MKIIKYFITGVFTVVLLFSGLTLSFGQATPNNDSTSFNKEQTNLKEIAAFRESYIPKEYLPLPESLIYVDLTVFLLIVVTGLILVLKRKPKKWLTWLAVITLAYLGIIRGGCICPVGLTTNTVMSILDPYQVSLIGLAIFIIPLLIALIAGRVFCTSGCPLGAIQHLIYKKKKDYKIPAKFSKYIKLFPILILFATIYFAISGMLYLGCELDPYKPIFFTGKTWFEQGVAYMIGRPMESRFLFSFGVFGWLYLLITLVLGYWVQRPFCRFLCPYSVLLGVVSLVAFKRRKIDETKCTYCSACVKKCPTQAITIIKKAEIQNVSNYDCINCNRCSDSCKNDAI